MQHTVLYWVFSQKNEICVSGRHAQACCTRPRPLTPPPCQNSAKGRCAETWNAKGKTVLQAQISFAILCFCLQNIFSWTWREIQPSMVTPTRNSCSAFTHPKCTHTAVNTHTHTHTHTHTEQHIILSQYFNFLLQNFIFFCNTSILLQIYAALFWLHTKSTHLHH